MCPSLAGQLGKFCRLKIELSALDVTKNIGGLTGDDVVYGWNSIGGHPSIKKKEKFFSVNFVFITSKLIQISQNLIFRLKK